MTIFTPQLQMAQPIPHQNNIIANTWNYCHWAY